MLVENTLHFRGFWAVKDAFRHKDLNWDIDL